MKFGMVHTNLNVLDMEKSLAFYKEALGMEPVRRKEAPDGSFRLAFLTNESSGAQIELTCLSGRAEPYDLGENEWHIAFETDDMAAAHAKHEAMGCICFENRDMGLYFIEDPDGYWLEIMPKR